MNQFRPGSSMTDQKKPFLYTFQWCGDRNQDMLFKRIWESPKGYPGDSVWAMHMDIEDPTPESVIIFVRGDTKREEIMDKINETQTYFREQVEKRP